LRKPKKSQKDQQSHFFQSGESSAQKLVSKHSAEENCNGVTFIMCIHLDQKDLVSPRTVSTSKKVQSTECVAALLPFLDCSLVASIKE
jgi:hypothetical protein